MPDVCHYTADDTMLGSKALKQGSCHLPQVTLTASPPTDADTVYVEDKLSLPPRRLYGSRG